MPPRPRVVKWFYKIMAALRAKKVFVKVKKTAYHRHACLKQFITTERNYVRDLQLIIDKIQKPLVDKKVITKEQERILFPNLVALIGLSNVLLEDLVKFQANWKNNHKMLLSTSLNHCYEFFKIYSEYCTKYYKGHNILKQIQHLPEVKAIQAPLLPMELDAYLIKPVQRPLKYQLLLLDYQSHMPTWFPDYPLLSSTILKYRQVNHANNDTMVREASIQYASYLSRFYQPLVDFDSRRMFFKCFEATTLRYELIKVYVFNDLVLITKIVSQKKEETLRVIELDGKSSFIQALGDGKYIDRMVLVVGKSECLDIRFLDSKMMSDMVMFIEGVIDSLYRKEHDKKVLKNKFAPRQQSQKLTVVLLENKLEHLYFYPNFKITVEGVERRALPPSKHETIYVIKYSLPRPYTYCQYVYSKFNPFEKIQEFIRKKYPQIILPRLRPSIAEVDINNLNKNTSKSIQYRMLLLALFLNFIIRCSRIMSNPLFIINELKLEQNLWQFAVEINEPPCKCQMCTSYLNIPLTVDLYMLKRKTYMKKEQSTTSKEFYCIKKHIDDREELLKIPIEQFDTYGKVLVYMDCKLGRIDYSMIYRQSHHQKYSIEISIAYPNGPSLSSFITELTTAGQLLKSICSSIQWYSQQDFGLFMDYETPRLVDNDERIYTVLTDGLLEESDSKGIFKKVKQKIQSFKNWSEQLWRGCKPKLYLRKYLFQIPKMEWASYHQNIGRVRWLVEQVFYDISSGTVVLNLNQMTEIAAMYMILKEKSQIIGKRISSFPTQILTKSLPKRLIPKIADINEWLLAVVKRIQEAMEQQNSEVVLLRRVLAVVYLNITWYSMLFKVKNHEESSFNHEVLAGVNYSDFILMELNKSQPFLKVPIHSLKYKVTPFSLFLQFQDKKYRFDGPLLFNLGKMLQKYKLYNRLFVSPRQSNKAKEIAFNRISC